MLAEWPTLRFETPGYLVLLAVIPLLIALSFRSLAGLGRARRVLALALRCLVVLMMVLALAGARRVDSTDALSVVFLFDRSSSVPRPEQQLSFEFMRKAQEGLRPTKDRMGVVAFDGRSAVEQLPMNRLAIDRVSDPLAPDQTNLAAALRMALALFTDDTARRVVVLSDGNENVGAALQEAEQYIAAGIPIDVAPIRYEHNDEVIFERLSAPPTATADETVNLRMTLRSQKPVSGRIMLWHNDALVDLDPASASSSGYAVQLQAGPNALTVPVPLRAAGAHRFRAVFEPDQGGVDTLAANNEGRAFTVVAGQGRALILTPGGTEESADDLESARILAAALEREKLSCDVEIVNTQPLDQVRLLEYSLVVLANVPAGDLSEEAHRALAVYVRDLGGGLIMLGGDDSFGAGGWMGTPVEEVMPVSFDVKSRKEIPKGALVLLMHACEIPEGNFIGERAAIAAAKTLSSRDLVGVLSWRWQDATNRYWDVPLQPVGDKGHIINLIKKMQMGDLPDFDPLMRDGVAALIQRSDAGARHMIIISDFDPAPPQNDIIADMIKHKITCSTIAIGFGGHPIDVQKARWIAEQTGGKYYETRDFNTIPQIFIKESRVVRRSLINENPFTPRLVSSTDTLVEGLAGTPMPPLGGCVLTTIKPLAQLPLVRKSEDGDDPVLAHWQVGLGRAVAFTSGMWTRWGAQWADWPAFSKLWAQIARWAARPGAAAGFDVSTSVEGGRGRIRVEALDKNDAALNFMNIHGTLVDPHYSSQPLELTQVGPGQYEAEFDARDAGSYVLSLAYQMGSGPEAASGALQTGLSIAFSPEFRELRANEGLLAQLAERTGGRVLDRAASGSAFDGKGLREAETERSIWETLIRLMLLLFLLDVAVRRIAIHPVAIAQRVRRFIREMASGGRAAESSPAVLTSLKGARERAREGARPPSETGPTPNRGARYEGRPSDAKVNESLSDALGGASATDAPVVAPPSKKRPPTGEPDFTSRLLKAKRHARDRLEQDPEQPGDEKGA